MDKRIYHFEIYYPGDRTPDTQYILMDKTFWEALRYAATYLLKNGCEIMVYSTYKKVHTKGAAIKFGQLQGMLKRTPKGIYWGTEDGTLGYIYPSVKDFGTLNRKEIGIRRS